MKKDLFKPYVTYKLFEEETGEVLQQKDFSLEDFLKQHLTENLNNKPSFEITRNSFVKLILKLFRSKMLTENDLFDLLELNHKVQKLEIYNHL